MAQSQNQLPLTLAKPRVVLQEDDEELLPIREKQPLDPYLKGILENRRLLLGDGFKVNEPNIYSQWSKDKPPMAGRWNVTDDKTGTMDALWWFGGVWWIKGEPGPEAHKLGGMGHDQFIRQFSWRGLKEVPKEAYVCPPYSADEVAKSIPGAAIDSKYIKRRAALEE